MISTFEGKTPVVGDGSYVHPSADVLGNVTIGSGCWIGPGARIRVAALCLGILTTGR